MIYQLNELQLKINGESVFVAPTAVIIGNVQLEAKSSIWFNTVLRGDVADPLIVGEGTNIQDGTICHTDHGIEFRLGRYNTIGHSAVIHGVTTGDHVLIGMGAMVLNGASIGENTVVGANTLIPEGTSVPAGVLIIGSPGKVLRDLTKEEIAMIPGAAQKYVEKSRRFLQELSQID